MLQHVYVIEAHERFVVIVHYRALSAYGRFIDTANVNLRKHRASSGALRSSPLGGDVSTFLPVRSTAFLQLAILKSQRVPQTAHFRSLPRAPKQIPDRPPVLHRESERDSVLTRKEEPSSFVVLQDLRVSIEVVPLPLAKVPLQIELFEQPSELCNPWISTHRITWRKRSRKLQTRGEFIPLFPHQIEAVSPFFQGRQCWLNRKLKILVVCLRRRLFPQGLSVERIVAARAYPPQG